MRHDIVHDGAGQWRCMQCGATWTALSDAKAVQFEECYNIQLYTGAAVVDAATPVVQHFLDFEAKVAAWGGKFEDTRTYNKQVYTNTVEVPVALLRKLAEALQHERGQDEGISK